MKLIDFSKEFPDEDACRLRFKQVRDKEGVVCKGCGSKEHYWLASKSMYQCKKCRFRTSLRSGSVMENSKLPFRYWFIAMMLMSGTKKSFSALEVRRQLGHKRYEPVWALMHKMRRAMGNRDGKYQLDGEMELDDAFIEAVKYNLPDEPLKRGRGSQGKSKVIVVAESRHAPNPKKHQKKFICGRIRMVCIPNLEAKTAEKAVREVVAPTAEVRSDNSTSWVSLPKVVKQHNPQTLPGKESVKVLPWVHTAIANSKRTLLGTHHMVSSGYLQNYLDEFCYKHNRRYFVHRLFDRILIAATSHWNQ